VLVRSGRREIRQSRPASAKSFFSTIPSTLRAIRRLSEPMLRKRILDDADAKSFVFDRRVPRFRDNPRKGRFARSAPEFGAQNERTKRNSRPPARRPDEALA